MAAWLPRSRDGRHHLMLSPSEWDIYAGVVTVLLTCGCRDGKGHRFSANPTGASLSITVWEKGRRCLDGQLAGRPLSDVREVLWAKRVR